MKETLQIPTPETLEALIGKELYDIWTSLCQLIEQKYNMEQLWNHGGKKWIYEYKYRKGGKTLCALYAKEQTIGFMVILGKDERAKFESLREVFSNETQKIYDETTTFHDGNEEPCRTTETTVSSRISSLAERYSTASPTDRKSVV